MQLSDHKVHTEIYTFRKAVYKKAYNWEIACKNVSVGKNCVQKKRKSMTFQAKECIFVWT